MSVNAKNLLVGPADLYVGAVGALEPTSPNTTPDPLVWTSLGGTNGGTTVTLAKSYTQLITDQTLMAPESVPTEVTATIATTLAEATLENLKVVLNGGTISTVTNTKTYSLDVGAVGVAPTYTSVLLVGRAPNAKKRMIIARKCLSTEGTGDVTFSKEDQIGYSATWTLHFVSDSVAPIVWNDDITATP